MKKIIISLFVGLLGATSCSDFLDENPKSSLTDIDYYKTEAQARANINYLYRIGVTGRLSNAISAYMGPDVSVTGMLTGYFDNSYEGQEAICKYARLLTRQEHTNELSRYADNIWDNCYEAINITNNAIHGIPNIKMDHSDAEILLGEAKFFRAFNYFYLVKTFGDVPLLLEPSTLKNLYPSRTPVAEVYRQIETDLKDAVMVLPALKFAQNKHRITQYAAAMLLADVYFQQGNYEEAKKYAKIVIDSPHALTANEDIKEKSAYNRLRSTDDLDEVIYCREYDASISNSSWWTTYAFTSSATAVFDKYSIFERIYGATDRFLNVYAPNDLRIQNHQFFHWSYTNPNNGKIWTDTESGRAGCWYYCDENALLNTGIGTKDWNFYRLAEAYLDYAESVAQTEGVTDAAVEYLARVQFRASTQGQTLDGIKVALKGLSKEAFIQACWTERLREFPLEFKLWNDCIRTMKFPVISETEKGNVIYVDLIGAQNASGATFKKTDLLFPISLNELQRNSNMTQNEGYAKK